MTKKEIINLAFEEIGIAYYTFDIQPEQYISALKRLDSMMSNWKAKGLESNYIISSPISGSSLEDDAILNEGAIMPVYTNLALELCSMFGKTPSVVNLKNANSSYKNLINLNTIDTQTISDKIILGAGYKQASTGLPDILDS